MCEFALFFRKFFLFNLEKLRITGERDLNEYFIIIGIFMCIHVLAYLIRSICLVADEGIKKYKFITFLSLFITDMIHTLIIFFLVLNLSPYLHPITTGILYIIYIIVMIAITSETKHESLYGITHSIIEYFYKKDKKSEKIKNYKIEYNKFLKIQYE